MHRSRITEKRTHWFQTKRPLSFFGMSSGVWSLRNGQYGHPRLVSCLPKESEHLVEVQPSTVEGKETTMIRSFASEEEEILQPQWRKKSENVLRRLPKADWLIVRSPIFKKTDYIEIVSDSAAQSILVGLQCHVNRRLEHKPRVTEEMVTPFVRQPRE